MQKKLYFMLFMTFISNMTFAQNDVGKLGLKISYFNDQIVRPGLTLGFEKMLTQKIREKQNGKTTKREIILKSNLGFYTQYRHSTSLFANATVGYKFTTNSGLTLEPLHIGIGYMQSFLRGKTFQVDDNGAVSEKKLASNSTLMLPYISLIGVGYDCRKKLNKPFAFSFSIDPYFQRPINNQSRLHLAIPFHFIYYIK